MIKFIKRLFGKDDSFNELMGVMDGMNSKWIALGERIAEDCFVNGLSRGTPVYLNQTLKQIHDEYKYKANVIEGGFLSKIQLYIESGNVINFSVEGGDAMFVHRDYALEVIDSLKNNPG